MFGKGIDMKKVKTNIIVLIVILFSVKSLFANDVSEASSYILKDCYGTGETRMNVKVDLNKSEIGIEYRVGARQSPLIKTKIDTIKENEVVSISFFASEFSVQNFSYTKWQKIASDFTTIKLRILPNIKKVHLVYNTLKTTNKEANIAFEKIYGRTLANVSQELKCLSLVVLETNIENNQTEGNDSTVVAASSGTGFFVSTNGHMVTNNHVIEGCDIVKAHYKGRELDADVLFTDRSNDLAIIKANIKPEKVFPVSNEDVSLLEDIIVAGYPLGKNISASIKTFKGSVTALAGFGDNYSNFQIDASLSSGNSGGPIINQKGNVVGVAVEKLVEVGVEGFNFGVKSSTLKTFASSNQIKFEPASTEELSNKELGQLITEATIYLECWMSVAKIKQIIQEGERQKAFFSEYK